MVKAVSGHRAYSIDGQVPAVPSSAGRITRLRGTGRVLPDDSQPRTLFSAAAHAPDTAEMMT